MIENEVKFSFARRSVQLFSLELLMQFDVTVLREGVRLVAMVAEQPAGLGHDVLHEASALSASCEGPTARRQCGERYLEQLVHSANIGDEILELELEDVQRVLEDALKVGPSFGYELQLLLYCASHVRVHEVGVDLEVAVHEDYA